MFLNDNTADAHYPYVTVTFVWTMLITKSLYLAFISIRYKNFKYRHPNTGWDGASPRLQLFN